SQPEQAHQSNLHLMWRMLPASDSFRAGGIVDSGCRGNIDLSARAGQRVVEYRGMIVDIRGIHGLRSLCAQPEFLSNALPHCSAASAAKPSWMANSPSTSSNSRRKTSPAA